MNYSARFITGLALASMLFAAPVAAQDATMQPGNTTVSVGGGTAILDLPDVQFVKRLGAVDTVSGHVTDADDFSDEIGWNVNAAITAPIAGNRFVSLSGFWASIDDDDRNTCTSVSGSFCIFNALVTNPATLNYGGAIFSGDSLITRTDREVDQAGAALEVRQLLTPGVMGVTQAPNARYLALGADWRAIYQDMHLNVRHSANAAVNTNYNEDIDTDYLGLFVAYGGNYTPFLFKGLWNRLGLQSSFRLQGGVYWADSDYSGRLTEPYAPELLNSSASDSNSEGAFIGGLTLETRKQIGKRAALSLQSKYEWYSYVPEMNYNDNIDGGALFGPNVGTTIGDDDAYAMRTSLRLTVKLGPDSVFEGPMK